MTDLREVLAIKAYQFLADHENIDWPEQRCREELAQISEPHSGDCTQRPWSCRRCIAEDCYRFADATIPAIAALPDPPMKAGS